jgi:acyl carrier protein/GNAT superfamily N-acetyltransferase
LSSQAAEQEIARIVRDELLLGSDRAIPFDEPLGELGLGLDSLALVNLLTGVEAAFGVELSEDVWAASEPLSVNDLAEILRRAPRTAAPTPARGRDSPVLHGRMERIEHALAGRGAAGRTAWAAARLAAPAIRFLFFRTRHLVLERKLDGAGTSTLAPPPDIELRTLAPNEEADLSRLWPPVHARRSRRFVARALREGAIALVACEGGRVVALDLVSAKGDEDVSVVRPRACYAFFLAEAPDARGRGIGLALAAYSFAVARRRGFRTQLTHVWDGNNAMLAAATQLLGFRMIGSALRWRVLGVTRWSWQVDGMRRSGSRLVL